MFKKFRTSRRTIAQNHQYPQATKTGSLITARGARTACNGEKLKTQSINRPYR